MNPLDPRRDILSRVASGELTVDEALAAWGSWPYLETGSASLDVHRKVRRGLPEVVLCGAKSPAQVREIFTALAAAGETALGTRASAEHFEAVREVLPDVEYEPTGRLLLWRPPGAGVGPVLNGPGLSTPPEERVPPYVAAVSAGTADEPVLFEAVGTLRTFGHRVAVIKDAGVAGLQRILSHVDVLREAHVVIVVAGMDGALPSVVAGLIPTPVIAVPTSAGYGASFQGLAALLAMLNSCSGGVGVVNIDNGFGAAYLASLMIRKVEQHVDGTAASFAKPGGEARPGRRDP